MMVPIWYLPVVSLLGMLIGFCLPLPRGLHEGRWMLPGPPRPVVPDNPNQAPVPPASHSGSNPKPAGKRKPAPPKSPPLAKAKGRSRG